MEKIGVDTYVIMDILSGNKDIQTKAKRFLQRIKTGSALGTISSLALTELMFHITTRTGAEKAEEVVFFINSFPNLSVIPASNEIALLAGKLRAKYYRKKERELSYLDCVHLATSIISGCSLFVTGDKDFRNITEINIEIYR